MGWSLKRCSLITEKISRFIEKLSQIQNENIQPVSFIVRPFLQKIESNKISVVQFN
jgi:hypothetical protein